MHFDNLAPLITAWPIFALLLCGIVARLAYGRLREGRNGSSNSAVQRDYWLKEAAWRARMQLKERFLPARSKRLTYQPAQFADDDSVAAQNDTDYPAGMADEFRTRLARAKFRAWHRGTREADFTIGGFYDRYHAEWGEAELAWFERLLEEDDVSILAWAMGSADAPPEFSGAQLAALKKLDFVAI